MAGSNSRSYEHAGVHYDILDAGKRRAIAAALSTTGYPAGRGAIPDDASRGESAFVFSARGVTMAMVIECLGTKSSIADEYQRETGVNRYEWIGYDGVAAITNDLCSVGALPMAVNAYFATGSASWYEQPERFEALVEGWRRGCEDSGAAWGGGESPMLAGIIEDSQIDLGGSAVGMVPVGRTPFYGAGLEPGDEIVLVASSGIQTNGASLARQVAEVQGGYGCALPDGTPFGDAVLAPSLIYVPLVEALLNAQIDVNYISHITGHGFRKLMRADRELTYRITTLPASLPVFDFMVDTLGLDDYTAYGTFNMGAGFAIYCPGGAGEDIVNLATGLGFTAEVSGVVEAGPRRVVIDELDLQYDDSALRLR